MPNARLEALSASDGPTVRISLGEDLGSPFANVAPELVESKID